MSQKINPNSLRTGVTLNWKNRWFYKKSLKHFLEEDALIKKLIDGKIGNAGIAAVEIERVGGRCAVFIKAARPGLVIGRGGKGIEDLRKFLEKGVKKLRNERDVKEPFVLNLNVEEVKRFDVSARVTAQNIAWDLEKRLPFRRVLKRALDGLMQNKNVLGAKIQMAGRLNGAEIARREWLAKGTLPLQTLRAAIDYGEATAFTTYGTIGVKVWINKKPEQK